MDPVTNFQILCIDDHPAPFRAVVIAEDVLLGRRYAGTIRIEEFERIEEAISKGFVALDFPPLEWMECCGTTARPIHHRLLVSILTSRMRVYASGDQEKVYSTS